MKIATNTAPTINYSIIETLEAPNTKIATDDAGNRYNVPMSANVGDVLVFPIAEEKPVYMKLEDFTIGRTL
jgi:hypothetical protein